MDGQNTIGLLFGAIWADLRGRTVSFRDGEAGVFHEHVCNFMWVEPQETFLYMGVSKNRGTPKWMVYNIYNGKPYEQMDDLGVPLFLETPI